MPRAPRGPRPADIAEAFRRALEASHRGVAAALVMLAACLDQFLAQGDASDAALASAAILISSQVAGNYHRFPDPMHMARLAIVRDSASRWRSLDDELLALSGLLSGLLFSAPSDAFLAPCVARIMRLLDHDLDVNIKFAAGRLVMYYIEPRELRALGQRVHSALRPCMDDPRLTPHRLGHWLVYWIRTARYAKEERQAASAEKHARQLANDHGLRDILFWLAVIDVERSLPGHDIEQAERALAVAESVIDTARLGEMQRLEFLKTKVAHLQGRGDRAVFHASRASQYATELEYPPPAHAVYIVNEAQARLMIDDFSTACDLLRRAADMVPERFVDEVRDMLALTESYQAFKGDDPGARSRLAAAWAPARARQFYDVFDGLPEFGAKLCALALEQGIETEFVRGLIAARNLKPPPNAPEAWPWALTIHALGGFVVQCRGKPLVFERKTQKKPIELLKVLIALGGRSVAKQKLRDVLWPDSESGMAVSTLEVAISRLRKLLREPDVIRVEDGKVGFDPDHVWLDVWALDRDIEALPEALRQTQDVVPVEQIIRRMTGHYGGPFLGGEDPQRWSIVARERWQNRFRRSLTDAARYWESRRDWLRAVALYERALEEDGLAEDVYRRLMQVYLARGQQAEAALVYRRCREMLSLQLGIPPSADTQALFQSIYGR